MVIPDTLWSHVFEDCYELRKKLNSCLIDAMSGKPAVLALSNELEAWILDQLLVPEVAQWALPLKYEIIRTLWEYSYGVPLSDADVPDREFDPKDLSGFDAHDD